MPSIGFKRKNYKMAFFLVYACIIFLIFGLIFKSVGNIQINGTYIKNPIEINDFHFIDQHGLSFSKKNLQGHWSFVFFGFTHCATVCPLTLSKLNEVYKKLSFDLAPNQLPQIVFISVDPERDTVERLKQFINSFNPHFVGIRADLERTIALEKEFHVTVTKSNTINHSMEILLLNPEAKIQAYFSYPHRAEKIVADYKSILKS